MGVHAPIVEIVAVTEMNRRTRWDDVLVDPEYGGVPVSVAGMLLVGIDAVRELYHVLGDAHVSSDIQIVIAHRRDGCPGKYLGKGEGVGVRLPPLGKVSRVPDPGGLDPVGIVYIGHIDRSVFVEHLVGRRDISVLGIVVVFPAVAESEIKGREAFKKIGKSDISFSPLLHSRIGACRGDGVDFPGRSGNGIQGSLDVEGQVVRKFFVEKYGGRLDRYPIGVVKVYATIIVIIAILDGGLVLLNGPRLKNYEGTKEDGGKKKKQFLSWHIQLHPQPPAAIP